MCYGCYTESKSYGYATVDPFGRFAPSVLLRSFRYAKLRLRQICRFCVSKWRCSAAKANFSYSPKASSFSAQDDTFGLSWSRMRACRPQTAGGLLEELHAILPRQPLQGGVQTHIKNPDKSKFEARYSQSPTRVAGAPFAQGGPASAPRQNKNPHKHSGCCHPICAKVFERGFRGKLFSKRFPLTHPPRPRVPASLINIRSPAGGRGARPRRCRRSAHG